MEVRGGHNVELDDVAVVHPNVGVGLTLYEDCTGFGSGYIEVGEGVDAEAGPVGCLE